MDTTEAGRIGVAVVLTVALIVAVWWLWKREGREGQRGLQNDAATRRGKRRPPRTRWATVRHGRGLRRPRVFKTQEGHYVLLDTDTRGYPVR